MIDNTLKIYWSAAYKARHGPDKSRWRAFLSLQCSNEADAKLRNLYLNLNKELNNGPEETNYQGAA